VIFPQKDQVNSCHFPIRQFVHGLQLVKKALRPAAYTDPIVFEPIVARRLPSRQEATDVRCCRQPLAPAEEIGRVRPFPLQGLLL
jgi:hypothetical protein